MSDPAYGPVEIYVVEFSGTTPNREVLSAVADLAQAGTVRLLDLLVASRQLDGTVTITEIGADSDLGSALGLELEVQGLFGDEDIAELVEPIEAGHGVALVALELTWATELAERLSAANGSVIRSDRIPAPIVNQLIREASTLDA